MRRLLPKYILGNVLLISLLLASLGYAAADTLIKQGTVTHLDNSVATVNWVVSYQNPSSQTLTNVILTDAMNSGLLLKPGTLQVPDEWSVMYSNDQGTSFSYDSSLSNINALRFTNPYVLPSAEGAAQLMALPLPSGVKIGGGGDGFAPVLLPNGRIMGVNHHQANPNIWCYDRSARAECAGYPQKLGAANGMSPMIVRLGLRLYIGDDSGGNTYGQLGKIYCWDADRHTSCGASPVVEGGGYVGPVEIDHKLYVWTRNGMLDCYDPANNLQRCANFSPVAMGFNALDSKSWWVYGNDILAIDKRIFIANTEGKLGCFDTATQNKCADWGTNPLSTAANASNVFKRLDSAGQVTGLCVAGYKQDALCYSMAGASTGSVALASVHAVQAGINSQGEIYSGTRTLFPQMYPENSVGCWDWATNAACTGTAISSGLMGKNVSGLPYGLATEGVCAYSFGDEGALLSWDIETGESPCRRVAGSMVVTLKASACAPSATMRWDKVKVVDANLVSGKDFYSLKVKVLNAQTGQPLVGLTEATNTNGEMDISFIPANVSQLQLVAYGDAVGENAWGDGVPPKLALSYYNGPDSKFCYQTTNTCASAAGSVMNTIVSNQGASASTTVMACNKPPRLSVYNDLEFLDTKKTDPVVDPYTNDDMDSEAAGLTYVLTGPDAALFTIDPKTGVISFLNPPSYSTPLDQNQDNGYEVTVTVTDSVGASDTKAIVIRVEADTDGDGTKDSLDDDIDGDGVPNDQEGEGDLDGDGIPSKYDPNEQPTVKFKMRLLLQGPYDPVTKLMRDDLRRLGLIPLKQPYGEINNSMYEGVESIEPTFLKRTGADAPVDWILIELRKADADATVVSQRAGLVLRNGDIVDPMTGNQLMQIAPVPQGYYYVVVRHRNHAAVVTDPPLWISPTITPLDFSQQGSVKLKGGDQAQIVLNGLTLMAAGDTTQDGRIISSGPYNDTNPIIGEILSAPNNTSASVNYKVSAYSAADLDMDGDVTFAGPGNDVNTLMAAVLSHGGNTEGNSNYIIVSGLNMLLNERPLSPYPKQ